jgi:hypothetical protein
MRACLIAMCLLAALPCAAQRDFLTATEVDQLREIQDPNARLPLYIGFAKQRVTLLQQLIAKEKTGRSGMIHEVIGEYTQIIDAIDTVTDDALRRRLPLDTGIKSVVEGEKEFLAVLNKIGHHGHRGQPGTRHRGPQDPLQGDRRQGVQGTARPRSRHATGGGGDQEGDRKERSRAEEEGSHPPPSGRNSAAQVVESHKDLTTCISLSIKRSLAQVASPESSPWYPDTGRTLG